MKNMSIARFISSSGIPESFFSSFSFIFLLLLFFFEGNSPPGASHHSEAGRAKPGCGTTPRAEGGQAQGEARSAGHELFFEGKSLRERAKPDSETWKPSRACLARRPGGLPGESWKAAKPKRSRFDLRKTSSNA
jgi:hypothetical protein